jgi:hypothetical protein
MPTYTVECANIDQPYGEHDFELELDARALLDLRSQAPAFLANVVCPTCATVQRILDPATLPAADGTILRARLELDPAEPFEE